MSRQNSLYAAVLLALVSCGLLASYLSVQNKPTPTNIAPVFASGNSAPSPHPQRTRDRVWKSVSFQRGLSIEGLNKPSNVKVDAKGNIFVLDWGNLLVKKFSEDGRLLTSYGKGPGDKPGQFHNPTDFTLTDDGEVLVCDPKGVITVFHQNGEVDKAISPKTPAMRVASAKNYRFITMAVPTVDHLFEEYAESGEFLRSFGHFIRDQSQNGLSLIGWIAEDGSNGFVYAGLHAGIIASYGANGELRFFVQTIDPIPLPSIEVTPNGVKKLNHKNVRDSALSISVAGDEIYLMTETDSESTKSKVIDVYNKKDGSYLYSSPVPQQCDRLYITPEHVYTVNENTVIEWQWQK